MSEEPLPNTTYVLYGNDDYLMGKFLDQLRQRIGQSDVLDANTTLLDGTDVTPLQIREISSTVPFLADYRLVIVQGLIQKFEAMSGTQRRTRRSRKQEKDVEEWDNISDIVKEKPASTLLVFLDGALRSTNQLLRQLKPIAETRQFRTPVGEELRNWIRQTVSNQGATIVPAGVNKLAQAIGGNLRTLNNEISKLVLYVGDGIIDEKAVMSLVANTRNETIFQSVDAVLAGEPGRAIQLINGLRDSGESTGSIFRMLARQLRLILVCQELLAKRVAAPKIQERLGLAGDFAVRKVLEQAKDHGPEKVSVMYRAILAADLSIKSGKREDRLALEVLIAQMARRQGSRAATL